MIFSDQCRVDNGNDNKVFIWKKVGDELSLYCVGTQHPAHPPPHCTPTPSTHTHTSKFSLMMWGCITYEGVGAVTVVDGSIKA